MNWHELYPGNMEPSMDDIADYMGGARELWRSLMSYMESAYKIKPKLTYSSCSMKPGWNIKISEKRAGPRHILSPGKRF